MDLYDAARRRRMVRAFTDQPVEPETLMKILDLGRRAPSAGNTDGRSYVLLQGAETGTYWDASLPAGPRREAFAWPGLVSAPVLAVVLASPSRYVARYAEADKGSTGLGDGPDDWSVPYWFVDGGMAVEAILLGAVAAGLGACFFGLFDHEAEVMEALGVPAGWRAVGTVVMGHPAAPDRPGRSAPRPRPPLVDVVHIGGW